MIILVINSGSSSLKYQLIDMKDEKVLSKGICDRIGLDDSFLKCQAYGEEEVVTYENIPNHTVAVQVVLNCLSSSGGGILSSMSDISAVGHRVVHGGEFFSDAALIDEKVMEAIRQCSSLAPLHNPANIVGIEACREILPDVPIAAIFDTAFHQTMPDYAYIYPLPYELYKKYKIRKYGFHGTSHKYVSHRAAEIIGKPVEKLKIISCHLGGGASVCAINHGKSLDTSMGFTPLEGLVMGTRSGTIDPAIITFLMKNENMSVAEMDNMLNKKSGILGISGISSDFRDIEKAAYTGNERAKLTVEVFCYRIKKFIGQYMAVMNGADAIVFTAGIGEHDWRVRGKSLENLECMGIRIDHEKNKNAVDRSLRNKEVEITGEGSNTRIFVIRTNEELMIARETMQLVMDNNI